MAGRFALSVLYGS